MLKLIAAAAALLAVASTVHADSCFTTCDQECLRTGSLARECQLECTQECPTTGGSTHTCTTTTDSSAHDACVANDVTWEVSCMGLFGPLGAYYCTSKFIAGVNACPATVTTTVCT